MNDSTFDEHRFNTLLHLYTVLYRKSWPTRTRSVKKSLESANSGVFDVKTDEMKSVSVMEGDSVSLHTDVKVQRDDQILWTFGPQNTRIAEIIKRDQINLIFVSNGGRFRDKLQLNNQTGSLTINNIRSEHTGLYKLTVIISGKTSLKSFSVTVYAPLPTPVITRNSSNCSSSSERSSVSRCSLLCSVLNVEYQDNNTYSCVLNNPIRNQTQHLDISRFCHTCAEHRRSYSIPVVVGILLVAIIAVLGGILLWHMRNHKQAPQTVENEDIHYATATFIAQPLHHTKPDGEDKIVYSSVATPKEKNLQYL
ncbi:uncharacterized protein si:ch211-236g6.1 isoform X3 [Onychostoma macrolepis]|uniref:uncharacterized protein si:ch211-236g6.1 isoform X3 n=1 Tax=Onychostoma macrolepis TaxID=369639 RepID=UPI002729CED3|nr:uncharacterized protein si:ch211-236g6.1 isoform X3 [Onychostoma macrolepis]